MGDDIVIWNKTVADRYLTVLKQLGVEVGLAKSIISIKGEGLEFAKKTILGGDDVSPVPFKEMESAHRTTASAVQFMRQHGMTDLQLLRFLGYGYKVDPSKANKVVTALHLSRLIPKTGDEFLSLFLREPKFIDWENLRFPIWKLKKEMINLLYSEISKLAKKSTNLLYKLASWEASCYVSSIGPWKTRQGILNAEIANYYSPKYLKELSFISANSKSMRAQLEPFVKEVNSIFWDIPFHHDQVIPRLSKFKPLADALLADEANFDSIQIDLLIKPQPTFSSSPKFMEERRVLRLWHQ